MLSKRCTTSAKGNENCSSAAVTNRMACQSRCEIQVQASHRRNLTACSKLSTPRNRAVWGLGCRSACQLSKRITDDYGRARTCPAAPAFNSPCRRSQTLRRDAALVSRPKEQATRPRVLLWVNRVDLATSELLPLFPNEQTFSGSVGMSQTCQKPKWHALFEHLVGASKQHRRNTQSNRSGRLEVDLQSESGWQFDRRS